MSTHELQGLVDSVVSATAGLPSAATLAAWKPALSGDIDIRIDERGAWWHEGSPIHREGLVRLFASLLRRESDGEYYLVTPAEKWRICVERHALQAIDVVKQEHGNQPAWEVLLNTGGRCRIDAEYRLHLSLDASPDVSPYVDLPNGLSAQLSRPAWYRLAESASVDGDRAFIESAGERFALDAGAL